MHSGQRLCSGHLSNEACKVLTTAFGHLFPPFPLLSLGAIAFPFPFTTLARRVGGWGLGGGGGGVWGGTSGSQERYGAGLQALSVPVPRVLPLLVPGPLRLRREKTLGASQSSELSEMKSHRFGATAELRVRVAALPTPRGRPAAPGGAAAGPPAAPLGPSVRAPGLHPHRSAAAAEKACARLRESGGGRGTETNNKPPPARPRPPLLFGNEFWQEISS